MSVSGICLEDHAVEKYKHMKMGKPDKMGKKCHGLVFGIVDKKTICCVKEMGECSNSDLFDFLTLEDNENKCCYVVFDLECPSKKELILIAWIPDLASPTDRMLYSTSVEALKKKFDGVKHYIVANDLDDLNCCIHSKYKISLKP